MLLPGDGTALGATARLFMVPFVGPARLGDVADGLLPPRDGPVVPLEADPPPDDEVPPPVCATMGEVTNNARSDAVRMYGMREVIDVSNSI